MKNSIEKIVASRFGLLWIVLILLGVNLLASILHTRVDLTKEKRYTLSKATRELALSLDDDVQIDVFLKGEFPSGFRKLANSTEEFLQLLKDRNGSRIHYRFISPEETMPGSQSTYGDSLVAMGAVPINLTVQKKSGESSNIIFPVALIKYQGKQSLVNIYPGASSRISQEEINSAEASMEYQFAKSLDALTSPNKPLVAYSIGNGEPTDARTFGLQEALRKDYHLFTYDINSQPAIPDTFGVMIIVKPAREFNEREKLSIDQYVMRGGKLLMFIDNLIAEQDSLKYSNKSETIAYDRNLNLTDLLFKYGVRVNPSLVMDLQCDFLPFVVGGSADNPQFEFMHWNYYPLFEPKGNHVINKNLGLVAGRFVNSIDTITTPGIKKTVLLSSSPNSRVISTPALISLNENKNAPQDEKFRQSDIPVAVLLEGRFSSLYRNRIAKAQSDSLNALGLPFRGQAIEENKIILVGDGDMALNDVSTQGPLKLGENFYTVGSQYEYTFANRQFLLNCVEYLLNKPAIIETRNKDIVLRLLDSQKVKEKKGLWQFINIGLPVLLVILAGLVYQQVRKRKYTS